MKIFVVMVAIYATIYMLHWISTDTDKAMEACQKIHSYNTCSWSVMR